MKKFFLLTLSALVFTLAASAQPRAIGLRLGGNAEVSYQHTIVNDNFLELDLGAYYRTCGVEGGVGLVGIYDFVLANTNNFSFYVGPGAQIGFFNVNDGDRTVSKFALGLAGQIGADYAFKNAPINLSLDWRPTYSFFVNSFYWPSFSLGIRYRF